ncbi:MAG: CDP-glucose 4,6-dehydratase [Dokdonella sp.]|uniref:CDP-glucose 4,6-dehydratase n=1 Tax=Dokdonella sp. TaxID=2291710 RepID=UPI0032650634
MEDLGLTRLFGGYYRDRRVLVTGHTGFKGSWLVLWLREMGARVSGLALDPDTSPNHWSLLALDDVRDHRGDIRDRDAIHDTVKRIAPEVIFHLAAQPLVRRGYREPAATFDTNVTGLINLYEGIRNCSSVRVVVNATTDKVYSESMETAGYVESDRLGGRDPYSCSKACAELVSDCYRDAFFTTDDGRGFALRIATARAGNVFGGGDWAEDRLVPDLVRAASSDRPLSIRNPSATRPWQHVLEPLSGYLLLASALQQNASIAGGWNFGPDQTGELSVRDLASRLGTHWPSLRITSDERPQPHEAPTLRLNSNKAVQKLSWRPVWNIDTALARTAAWYRQQGETGEVSSVDDLRQYVVDARAHGLGWAT